MNLNGKLGLISFSFVLVVCSFIVTVPAHGEGVLGGSVRPSADDDSLLGAAARGDATRVKKFLTDEVLVGTISQEEFDLITSYGGRLKARLSWRGKAGAAFVYAVANGPGRS